MSPEITTFSLHMTKRAPWRALDLLIRLGEERPDLIIAYLFHSYMVARILGKLFRKIPVVSSFRSGYQKSWRSFLDRTTMALTDFFVVPSKDTARFARKVLRVPEDKLHVILNGVDGKWLRSPQVPREQTRAQLGFQDQDFVIGCVARLHPVKDHETLLRAFKELKRKDTGSRAKLLLVGKGDDDLNVRSLTERLGLLEHVVFAGFRRDLPEVYSAMDAFCLTSKHEGLPTSVLEAMSTTRPIVATEAPGITAILSHEQNALLAPIGNATAVSGALARVIDEPQLAQRLTQKAADEASEQYSIESCSAAYDALVSRLLEKGAR